MSKSLQLKFIDSPTLIRYLPPLGDPRGSAYPAKHWQPPSYGGGKSTIQLDAVRSQIIDAQVRAVRGRWQRSVAGSIGLAILAVVLDVLLWRSFSHPTDWMLLYLTGGPTFTFFAVCWGLGARWAARTLFGIFLLLLGYLALGGSL